MASAKCSPNTSSSVIRRRWSGSDVVRPTRRSSASASGWVNWERRHCTVQADASCVEELREAWKRIWERYGRVHGLVHSAVGAFDESIAEMEEAKFREVLSAKMDVSVRMAQVFAGQELDWVMVFSSLNSFAKDAGKAGYSAGSVFVDSFAQQLGREWSCPVKVVNWGYWGEVDAGGVVPQSMKNRLAQSGIGVIEADDGMLALEQLLGSTLSQVAYLKTTRPGAIAGVDVEEKLRQAVQQTVAFEWSEEPLMVVPELNGEQAAEMAGLDEQLLRKLLVGQLQSLGLVKGKRQSVAAWQRELGVVAGTSAGSPRASAGSPRQDCWSCMKENGPVEAMNKIT